MIYLIGGPLRVGKTTLANKLADALAIPYFSFDHLGSLIKPYIPKDELPVKFPLFTALSETG